MVGSVMAADLHEDGWSVTLADRAPAALERAQRLSRGRLAPRLADLTSSAAIREAVADADVVLGALPGHMGHATLRAVIEAGKSCCDISFMPEDPRDLDALARERGVTAIVDCGVAPGLSNLLCGRAVARLDSCDDLEILVGGLPAEPELPFEYKAAFSPIDVIEEYVRPARFVEGGTLRTCDALSGIETVQLPGAPPLEAFFTDGLRSLADTLEVPAMREKTLRYAGHARLMRAFRDVGLFGTEPLEIGGARVRPIDLTTRLLFPRWTYAEGEHDLTLMRVTVRGSRAGRAVRLRWDLLDRYDAARGFSSMARTTGFPCTLLARELVAGAIDRRGVIPPELLGGDEALLDRVLHGLAARGVSVVAS